jgi:hypothetical protein
MNRNEKDLKMFGCPRETLDQARFDAVVPIELLVISILSDAQHVLENDDTEQARQFINRAKYILSEQMTDREAGRAKTGLSG